MQFKAITAIIVLFLVVASLSLAGCINTTNKNNQTPTAATQHDAFLEKFLTAVHYTLYLNSSLSMKAWQLTWINSTSARLQSTATDKTTNLTWARDGTYVIFPTTQDATNYLNAMNLTAYSLASTRYGSEGPYIDVAGHPPQIFISYTSYEGNPSNISEYKYYQIAQSDNIVLVETAN